MRLQPIATAAVALAAAGGLAACGTAYVPPPASLAFAGQACAAQPDLAKALSLTPEKPKTEFVVTTEVGAAAACLKAADGQGGRPYLVYALPADPTGKTVTVGGLLEATRIFSPDVALLDADGHTVRTFRPADYYYRGAVFSVQFQPKAAERYLLVAADPARIGQRYDAINIGTQTTAVSTGYVTMTWTRGTDTKTTRTFSYDGEVQVTVNAPKPEAKTGA